MPKNTARIGKDDEREIVKDLEKRGYRARRQPGSGNRAVDLQHDAVWQDSPVGRLHVESKYRRDSQWKTLEKYRAGADILTVRCDNRLADQNGQRMVFMSWELFLDLVGEHWQRQNPDTSDPTEKFFAPNSAEPRHKPKKAWPKGRKIKSRGFPKGKRALRS